MRVLLVNSNRFMQPWPVIPFGICYVASSVEAAGHQVKVLDLCFSRNTKNDISHALREFDPELVGVSIRNIDSCTGFDTQFLLDSVRTEVIDPLKRLFDGPIVIGGSAAGINGAEMLDFFDLNYAISGDGEAAIVELISRLESGGSLEDCGGLILRREDRIAVNNPPLAVCNLDSLPFARPYRWLELAPYISCGSAIQIQTKRGCALKCSYCTYNRIEGRSYRLRSPESIVAEIAEMVRETGIHEVEFTDSTLNIPQNHAKAVLRAMAHSGLKLRLRAMGLNPRALDEEMADLLVEAGFFDADLGVESGCDKTLKSLGKDFNKEDVIRAGRLLRDRRIPSIWYLLVGSEEESPETLAETFRTISSAIAPWDLVTVGIGVRVYNGSPISEKMRTAGDPGARDNFFKPVAVHPRKITLDNLKLLTKQHALKYDNWFMYDEDNKLPIISMRLFTMFNRLFGLNQPLWRGFIFLRKLQRYTGFSLLRRTIFNIKHRARLKLLSDPQL